MGWKSMLWPAEYDPSGRFKRGSQIAKLLDHAKIPYVACGDLMDGHYEIEHLATSISICFVVPDDRLDAAIRALRVAGLSENPCTAGWSGCCWANLPTDVDDYAFPWPAKHFHHYLNSRLCYPVGLLRKSQWLWLMPDLPLEFPEPNDPNFILSTDRRLPYWDMDGYGNSFYPIKLLTPARWIESLFSLHIRDLSTDQRFHEYWYHHIVEFNERLARLLPPELFHIDLIQPPFRTLYIEQTDRRNTVNYKHLLMDRLWEEWQEAGSMPDPVFPFDSERYKKSLEDRRLWLEADWIFEIMSS
ncbi:MaoC like domain family protein [Aspergillus tubingensis]|uniref:MaoC like domain family protein n=1 Tax=Aspergillus tubingensis TaxID=5068 RepID=UPI00157976C3|nr:MaoC like domain family protein [Aspergillus tubingensis]GFN10332.1 MaoC like domain family protein [Aspergillus tubingensis]